MKYKFLVTLTNGNTFPQKASGETLQKACIALLDALEKKNKEVKSVSLCK
jgi:hypothetical protein